MARITVVTTYQVQIQEQPEKSGIDKNGNKWTIPFRPAGTATKVLAQHDDQVLEFVLPSTFRPKDFGFDSIQDGDVLHVRCPDLEKIKPLSIFNVDAIKRTGKK